MRPNVRVIRQAKTTGEQIDLFSDDAIPAAEVIGFGELTTDHTASRTGYPQLLMDGNVYSPADVVARGWEVLDETVYPDQPPEMYEDWRREWTRIAYQQTV